MPKNHLSPHDRFVKSMMHNPKVAHEFFDAHLPQHIKDITDLNTLSLQSESFVNDKLRLKVADLLYTVDVKGEIGYLYILLEHQSSPDKLMPFRLLQYMTAIMEAHLKKTKGMTLPFVYPLVFYTGNKPYTYSMDLFDLFGSHQALAKQTLMQPYQLIEVNKAPDEVLKQYRYFGLMALIAKHIHDPNILPFLKDVLFLLKELENDGEADYIYVALSYIVEAGEIVNDEEFTETIKSIGFKDEDKVMTIAELFTQKGFTQGMQQGIETGMQRGIETGRQQGIETGMQRGIETGRQQGIETGKTQAVYELALKMLSEQLPLAAIERITGLSPNDIKKLQQNIH